MKIPSSLNVPAAGTGSVADRAGAPKAATKDAPAVSGSSVRLSELSAHLTNAGPGADFDQAKVQSIKQAIAEGRMPVNADAIASRLIQNALALSGSKPK